VEKKAPAKKAAPKQKTQNDGEKVALFAPNPIVHPILGRLNRGYTIVSANDAEQWLKISEKVREASPQEVASAYEV
jgi:hypothetical protein